ncbi:MAG: AAA family ATPase [Deltaproteobacteria bacterium]|nr:AAA family ATPase [Deltaproteobacteria bacterium]MCB9786331.1 AAA family ATPase [Deltaproteobacteria bacterium]
MIIGLTGKYAAGKGTVAEVLKRQGFRYHSLSDILREELAQSGQAESREALLAMGNALRRQGGPGVLAERLVPRLRTGDHIVDSIRNPAEVTALRALDGFVLLAVDAAPAVRFERLRERARIGDPTGWEEFTALEARENVSADPAAQQLLATSALADRVLMNDGDIEALEVGVSELLAELRASVQG